MFDFRLDPQFLEPPPDLERLFRGKSPALSYAVYVVAGQIVTLPLPVVDK
jgi:hypothetical protein